MRPQRLQYRPLSIPLTFLYSGWWDWGLVEFSVWRIYDLKREPRVSVPGPWKFTINIGHGRWVIDMRRSR